MLHRLHVLRARYYRIIKTNVVLFTLISSLRCMVEMANVEIGGYISIRAITTCLALTEFV